MFIAASRLAPFMTNLLERVGFRKGLDALASECSLIQSGRIPVETLGEGRDGVPAPAAWRRLCFSIILSENHMAGRPQQ